MADFKFVTRHRLHTTDSFWFEVDEYLRPRDDAVGDQLLMAHVRVVRWSPSVRKEIHRVWKAFRACVTIPVFAIGEVDDNKWERFVRLLGFEPFQEVTCENGGHRRLFIHVLAKDPHVGLVFTDH